MDEPGPEKAAGRVTELMLDSEDEGGLAMDDQNFCALIQPDTDKGEVEKYLLDKSVAHRKKDHKQQAWKDIYCERSLPKDLEQNHHCCDEGDEAEKLIPIPLQLSPKAARG